MGGEIEALELAKKCIEQVFEPYKDIMQNLLGPATTQVGLTLGDQVALWRSKRLVRFMKDFHQFALDNGLKVKPVPPRLLFPICENGALEDDKDLYTRWIALLANAMTTDHNGEILPCFPEILKQLTSEEAHFLDRACDEVTDAEKRRLENLEKNPGANSELGVLALSGGLLRSVHPVLIENLERLMLVTRTNVPLTIDDAGVNVNIMPPANHLYVSELGKAFVRACRLPQVAQQRNQGR